MVWKEPSMDTANIFGGFFVFSGAAMLLVGCIWFWFEVLANFLWRQACFCIAAFGVIIAAFGVIIGAAAAAVSGAAGFAAAAAIAMLIFLSVFAVGAAAIWLVFPIVNWQAAKNPFFTKLIGVGLAIIGALIAG